MARQNLHGIVHVDLGWVRYRMSFVVMLVAQLQQLPQEEELELVAEQQLGLVLG